MNLVDMIIRSLGCHRPIMYTNKIIQRFGRFSHFVTVNSPNMARNVRERDFKRLKVIRCVSFINSRVYTVDGAEGVVHDMDLKLN